MRIRSNGGFSLVELAISLGLIAILLSVVSAGGGMVAKTRIGREIQAIDNLRLAAQNYLSVGSMTYSGVSVDGLKTAGYLPATFVAAGSNSFGGGYAVAANEDPTRVDIVLSNVPDDAGTTLSESFRGKAMAAAYDAGSKSLTVTF